MASSGRSSTLFIQVLLFVLALALLLATCMASRDFHRTELGDMKVPKQLPLKCNTVYAVQDGETCTAIAQQFKLTTADLSAINPNFNCDKLFVGQWICINGGSAK